MFLDIDSHFFINIKRLETTRTQEFKSGYEKVNKYFYEIGLLLRKAQPGGKLYNAALKRFDFSEVEGINLGFSKGGHGAGFGKKLREKIIADACEIIQTGSEDPEIFHLVSLFEGNVGPDRLSDMIARILYEDIKNYTIKKNNELGITKKDYPDYCFIDGVVKNPYKDTEILLLPTDILHEIPIAVDWDDIDRVCHENAAIRAEINNVAADDWYKMSSADKKNYLKEHIFKKPDCLRRVLGAYRETTVDCFDVFSNLNYLLEIIKSSIEIEGTATTSFEASKLIVGNYKEWVENHRGYLSILEADSRRAEKAVQRTLHAVAIMYCKEHNWDINPEEDSGRGPVDFKISRGNDKTVIEIKLTSNKDCVHGFETQIEEYAMAECTNNKIFVVVDNGKNSGVMEKLCKKRNELEQKGLIPAEIVSIDARGKLPASKYQKLKRDGVKNEQAL